MSGPFARRDAGWLLALCWLLVVLAGCGPTAAPATKPDAGHSPDADTSTAPTITVAPDHGAPSTVVVIKGIVFADPAKALVKVQMAGQNTTAKLRADGAVLAAIPLFLGNAGWPVPPAGRIDVVVFDGDKQLAEIKNVLAVDPLPKSPGAAKKLATSLEHLVAVTKAHIEAIFPATTDKDKALRAIGFQLLDAVLTTDANSLQAVLAGTAPVLHGQTDGLELLDAVLGAGGAAEQIDESAARIAALAAGKTDMLAGMCQPGDDDVGLACEMQLAVIAQLFSEQVISTTSNQFQLGLGTVLVGLNVPAFGIASGVVGAVDFFLAKFVVGGLPTKVTGLTHSLAVGTLYPGQVITPHILLTATNDPPTISLQEIINQFLGFLGYAGAAADVQGLAVLAIKEYCASVLALTQNFISSYASANPGVLLDTANLPLLTFGPVEVHDARLVKLVSLDTSLIDAATGISDLKWAASATKCGTASVYAVIRSGSESTMLLSGSYVGGAFGSDIVATPPESVEIKLPIDLQITLQNPVPITGATPVHVRVGVVPVPGNATTWVAGLPVTLQCNCGGAATLTPTSVVTNADGWFEATLTPNNNVTPTTQFLLSATSSGTWSGAPGCSLQKTITTSAHPDCGAVGRPCCPGSTCATGSHCASGTCVPDCGADGQACCSGSVCNATLFCSPATSICGPCGSPNQACCPGATPCASGTCQSGTCSAPCGGQNQPCCSGSTCLTGNTCVSGNCQACGGVGLTCCTGSTCSSGLTCITGNGYVNQCGYCGEFGMDCCPGDKCEDGSTCLQVKGQQNKVCTCGEAGQPCCPAGIGAAYFAGGCIPSAVCQGSMCTACGGFGQPCCTVPAPDPGSEYHYNGDPLCGWQEGLVCAGGKCALCGQVKGDPCCINVTKPTYGPACVWGACSGNTCVCTDPDPKVCGP